MSWLWSSGTLLGLRREYFFCTPTGPEVGTVEEAATSTIDAGTTADSTTGDGEGMITLAPAAVLGIVSVSGDGAGSGTAAAIGVVETAASERACSRLAAVCTTSTTGEEAVDEAASEDRVPSDGATVGAAVESAGEEIVEGSVVAMAGSAGGMDGADVADSRVSSDAEVASDGSSDRGATTAEASDELASSGAAGATDELVSATVGAGSVKRGGSASRDAKLAVEVATIPFEGGVPLDVGCADDDPAAASGVGPSMIAILSASPFGASVMSVLAANRGEESTARSSFEVSEPTAITDDGDELANSDADVVDCAAIEATPLVDAGGIASTAVG